MPVYLPVGSKVWITWNDKLVEATVLSDSGDVLEVI